MQPHEDLWVQGIQFYTKSWLFSKCVNLHAMECKTLCQFFLECYIHFWFHICTWRLIFNVQIAKIVETSEVARNQRNVCSCHASFHIHCQWHILEVGTCVQFEWWPNPPGNRDIWPSQVTCRGQQNKNSRATPHVCQVADCCVGLPWTTKMESLVRVRFVPDNCKSPRMMVWLLITTLTWVSARGVLLSSTTGGGRGWSAKEHYHWSI